MNFGHTWVKREDVRDYILSLEANGFKPEHPATKSSVIYKSKHNGYDVIIKLDNPSKGGLCPDVRILVPGDVESIINSNRGGEGGLSRAVKATYNPRREKTTIYLSSSIETPDAAIKTATAMARKYIH